MRLLDWLQNKPSEGYREVALEEVKAVLKTMGYVGIDTLTVADLTTPSKHVGMPGMGGGYTPLGQYAISEQPEKVVYVSGGKIFEQVTSG